MGDGRGIGGQNMAASPLREAPHSNWLGFAACLPETLVDLADGLLCSAAPVGFRRALPLYRRRPGNMCAIDRLLKSATGWPDILVHAEEVVGIVTALDFSQTAVVCAIRLLDPILFIVGHEVDVDAAGGEG